MADEVKKEKHFFPVRLKKRIRVLTAQGMSLRVDADKWLKWSRKAEEARHKNSFLTTYDSLTYQRKVTLRKEARAHHLAYGFLRGVDYKRMEHKAYELPVWELVLEIITECSKKDSRDINQKFAEWTEDSSKL